MNKLFLKKNTPRISGPFGDADSANVLPQQVISDGTLKQIAAQSGKQPNQITWDDVYKLTGALAGLWQIIAPYVLARRTTPPPPQWTPPPAQKAGFGTAGTVLMVLLLFGLVVKKSN